MVDKGPISEHQYFKVLQNKIKQTSGFQGQVVRLLFSPKSNILSVHLVNLDPFCMRQSKGEQKAEPQVFTLEQAPLQQVFLERNLKRMREVRPDPHGSSEVE